MQISVIIPVYNDFKHLEQCLRSISEACPQPYEVIVIDDGSTYDMRVLEKEFPFVQIIRQKLRMGPGYARYIGVQAARGDVVAFLDSDCYIKRDWFEVIHSHLQEDMGGIMGGYIPCNLDHFVAFYEAVDLCNCYSRNAMKSATEAKFIVGGCCAFWKRVLLCVNLKSSFIFGGVAAAEDTLLALEVGRKYKIMQVDAMMLYHHYHEIWRQYFYKRFIDAWKHAVIFLLYNRDVRNRAYINYPYVILHLGAIALLVYGLKSGSQGIFLSIFLVLLYSEIRIFRYAASLKNVNARNKLGFLLVRFPCLLLRNVCWLAGIISGLVYFLINYDKLVRFTVSTESNLSA